MLVSIYFVISGYLITSLIDASKLTNRRLSLIGDSFAQEFMNMAMETKSLFDYEICCYYIRLPKTIEQDYFNNLTKNLIDWRNESSSYYVFIPVFSYHIDKFSTKTFRC